RGEDPIAPKVAHALLRRLRAQPRDDSAAERIRTRLTSREREVLRRVGRGQGIREIACDLAISPKTARNHLSNLLGKLRLENRVQASLYAARAGLLDDAATGEGPRQRPVIRGGGAGPRQPVSLNGTSLVRGPASSAWAIRGDAHEQAPDLGCGRRRRRPARAGPHTAGRRPPAVSLGPSRAARAPRDRGRRRGRNRYRGDREGRGEPAGRGAHGPAAARA